MDRSILSVYNALSLCGDVFREEGETINNPPCFRIATELPITHYPLPITPLSPNAVRHTQTEKVTSADRITDVPRGASGVNRSIKPAAAANDADRTRPNTVKVVSLGRRIIVVPVPAPFPHVSAHIV